MSHPDEKPFAFLKLDTIQAVPAVPLFLSEFDQDGIVYTSRSEIRFEPFQKQECIEALLLEKKDEQGELRLRFEVPCLYRRVYSPGNHAFLPPGAFVLALNEKKLRDRLIQGS